WVAGHADVALARAADDLIAKIADTVPERLRPFVLEPASRARPGWSREPDRIDMVRTRAQIHEGKKITLHYRDEQGRDSERTNWPRFSTEDDAALGLIPANLVNEKSSGMRCEGDRCAALQGKVGIATSCGIYAIRPEVCRTCMPGDAECAMARKKHGLPVLSGF